MFVIKKYISKSKVHGIGLFSDQIIKKGKKIYIPNQKLDLVITNDQYKKLGKDEKYTISHYGFKDKETKLWNLSFDDIRFCNHSEAENNITLKEDGCLYATKDIMKNEEILQNYYEFEKTRGY